MLDKTYYIVSEVPLVNKLFESYIKYIFPGTISNSELEWKVVLALVEYRFHTNNTLLAISLCSDELTR